MALKVGAAAPSCNAKVLVTPPAVAERVALWLELTAETFAVKEALEAPDAIATVEGTVTAALLLDSDTPKPLPVTGPVKVTVQESVPAAE